jgi:putative ABC transport system substrate-binding protein
VTTRRTAIRALGAIALSAPFAARPQRQAGKVYRLGFFGTAFEAGYVRELDWIRAGLRKFGYEEGKNLVIEYRWAEGNAERMRQIAAEFTTLKLDAVLVHGIPGAVAMARESSSIPIVMADGADPVAVGLAASLARPGRNVTGSTSFVPEESAKRLEILKEVLPRLKRAAFLRTAQPPPVFPVIRKALDRSAASMNVELREFAVRDPGELPDAFRAMEKAGMEAVLVNNEPLLNSQASVIAALASVLRLPSIGYPNFADSGGLLAYGASRPALYGRVGYFVDLVLKGTKPGEIPIEQAAKFDLVVNLKTAHSLGVAVPQSVTMRSDRLIQ